MSKQFFNMIAREDGTACILLYGDIGSYDSPIRSGDIVRELLEIENAYEKIDIWINSMGGEVYAGIAIFNAIRNSRADIKIYVDGIAASIASVIASCGKPVYMSRYARLMVHSVSGGCYGSKEELRQYIQEIESLEDTLADIYALRCQRDKEEIKQQFFDGGEHWFTAEEALAAGLETENADLKSQLKAYKDKEEADAAAARTALVDAAVKDGRIKEPQREVYLNLLKSDPVNGESALKALKPSRRVMDDLHNPPAGNESPWEKRMKEIKNNLKK